MTRIGGGGKCDMLVKAMMHPNVIDLNAMDGV